VILLLLACAQDESALEDMLRAGSSLEECEEVSVGQLRTLCYVEVAGAAGSHNDDATANAACAAIPDGVWRQECHFRAGEELGKAGQTDRALRHCVQAGEFAPNCLTHTFWGLPLGLDLDASNPATVNAAMDEFLVTVDTALLDADPMLRMEARDGLLSRAWFNLYVGTGQANPVAAKGAPVDQAPYARTAWAMEAARVHPEPTVDALRQAWNEDQILTGLTQTHQARVGQHARPLFPHVHHDVQAIFIFGGGRRLVSPELDLDLLIAILEGLFYSERSPELWSGYIGHDDFAVRQTAIKNTVLVGGDVTTEDPLDQEIVRAAKKERRSAIRRNRPPRPLPGPPP